MKNKNKKIKAIFGKLSAMVEGSFGYGGLAALGWSLGFAAHDALFWAEIAYPGLIIAGPRGSGKTTLGKAIVACWGCENVPMLEAHISTQIGLRNRLLETRGVPVWVDNMQPRNYDLSQSVLNAAFQRDYQMMVAYRGSIKVKGKCGGTSLMLSGESLPDSAITRSKYFIVSTDGSKAYSGTVPTAGEMTELGNFLRENGEEFSRAARWHFEQFKIDDGDPRKRITQGIPYAAFVAAEMFCLGIDPIEERPERAAFKGYMQMSQAELTD